MNKILQKLAEMPLDFGEVAFCRLGQQSYLVKLGQRLLGIDLYLTPETRRLTAPCIRAEELTGVDAFFATHDHRDHLDRPQLAALAEASPDAVLVVPEAVRASVTEIPAQRLRGVNAAGKIEFSGIRVSAIPAAHETLQTDAAGNFLALGYIFQGNGFTFFHAGDCCPYPELLANLKAFSPDAVLLPINGRDDARRARGCLGCMDFREAGDLAGALSAAYAVPGHYDMFAGNTEDPERFADYVRANAPQTRPVILPPGEIRVLRALRPAGA